MRKLFIAIGFAAAVLACGKKDNPNPEDPDGGEIWYPEKSQPGIFKVPEILESHGNEHARQTYAIVTVLESIVAEYNTYFLVPTEYTKPTSGLGDRFEYTIDGHRVSYMYGDFVDSHRVFELEAKNAAGGTIVRAQGDWWEDWNAEDGKPETGRHYGNLSYFVGAEANVQTKEFSWIDDGGGNYRVELLVWSPNPDSYLAARYRYVFNADRSGSFTYWSYPPTGGGDYWRAGWKSSGAGELTKGEGGMARTYRW